MAARPTLRSMIGQLDHQTVQHKQRLSSLRRRKTLFLYRRWSNFFWNKLAHSTSTTLTTWEKSRDYNNNNNNWATTTRSSIAIQRPSTETCNIGEKSFAQKLRIWKGWKWCSSKLFFFFSKSLLFYCILKQLKRTDSTSHKTPLLLYNCHQFFSLKKFPLF